MLSVVIPSYNHRYYLEKNVPKIMRYLEKKGELFEIIVVDDGSSDGTGDAAEKLGVRYLRNQRNRGKGYSLRRGISAAKGDHILMTDTDLAAPIENLEKLWAHRDKDLVFGSRRVKGACVESLTVQRKILGGAYHIFLRCLLRLPIQDTQCGFKLFSSRVKGIAGKCRIDGFAFDTELAFLARKKGLSMKEVGICWEAQPDSRVVVWKHPFQMLGEVITILMNDARGVYRK
jgi:dolichyl-phosphate beta-glucosyltransferase